MHSLKRSTTVTDPSLRNIRIIHAETGKTIRASNRFATTASKARHALGDISEYIEDRLGRETAEVQYLGPDWSSTRNAETDLMTHDIVWVFTTKFKDGLSHCQGRDRYGDICTAYPSYIKGNQGACGRHKRLLQG